MLGTGKCEDVRAWGKTVYEEDLYGEKGGAKKSPSLATTDGEAFAFADTNKIRAGEGEHHPDKRVQAGFSIRENTKDRDEEDIIRG